MTQHRHTPAQTAVLEVFDRGHRKVLLGFRTDADAGVANKTAAMALVVTGELKLDGDDHVRRTPIHNCVHCGFEFTRPQRMCRSKTACDKRVADQRQSRRTSRAA